MKKSLLFLAFGVVLCIGCSNNEATPKNASQDSSNAPSTSAMNNANEAGATAEHENTNSKPSAGTTASKGGNSAASETINPNASSGSGEIKLMGGYKEIQAFLDDKCTGCHGGEHPKEGINLTSYANLMKGNKEGPIIVPGDPEHSLLIRALKGDGVKRMPPIGDPLPESQYAPIAAWIKQGAKGP